MPYCPDCRYIYREGVEVCPDCGTALVDEELAGDEHGMVESETPIVMRVADALFAHAAVDADVDLVSVYRAPDESLAELVLGMLQSEGIAAAIHSEQSAVLEGVLDPAAAFWAEILVPEPDAEQAREIVAAYLTGHDLASAEEEPEDPDAAGE